MRALSDIRGGPTAVRFRGCVDDRAARQYLHTVPIKTLLDAATISTRVSEMGRAISRDHQDSDLVVVPVLKGSFMFAADLVRSIDVPCEIDFLGVRSYDNAESSGVVQITHDLSRSIEDKHVILVEDIVDTGLTVSYLYENLETRQPASIQLAALLHKPARTRIKVEIDYLGFTIEDVFVVGYGLDLAQKHRNLPHIGEVT